MSGRPLTDAAARLHQAQSAAIEGRHEEALREYIWFHNHALRHQPSLYGVRLSFALWYWMELARVYPKARRELERIRARKTKILRSGRGTRDLFHDVTAINEHLRRPRETYRLFRKLRVRQPRLASRCAMIAMPAIVGSRDFELARRYLRRPEERVARLAARLNKDIAGLKEGASRTPARHAYTQNYCRDVRMLIVVLRGVRERDRAAEIRGSALGLVNSRSVRKAVAAALAK
jgi:hypothetical protein